MNAYRNILQLAMFALIVTVFAGLPKDAMAQMPVQQLKVTVSQPVEVPHLVLPAGDYIFEALENGQLTRILSADQTRVFTTLLTQPAERLESVDNAAITLLETRPSQVERIDAWFFPGESVGNEFLYPGSGSAEKLESTLSTSTKEAGRLMEDTVEDAIVIPEHAVVHAEHAVVSSSVATGHFFRANFLVH